MNDEDARLQLGDLGLQALGVLEDYEPGRARIGDAILLVEIALLDVDGDSEATAVHYFSTTERSIIRRGLIEHVRDGMMENNHYDDDPDDP